MKNREKYKDEIEMKHMHFCADFVNPKILKPKGLSCNDTGCNQCRLIQSMWLDEEYVEPKEPEVDWSEVEVDTPILVKSAEYYDWMRFHFAKYKNGMVYAWDNGRTSWNEAGCSHWTHAKLPKDGNEESE